MYVAATRARDQLVFAWHDTCSEAKKSLNKLDLAGPLPSLVDVPHDELVPVSGAETAVRVRRAERLPPAPDDERAFGVRDAEVQAALCASSSEERLASFRARRLEELSQSRGRSRRWRSVKDVAERRARARGATRVAVGTGAGPAVGTAVHGVMEELDLGAEPELLRVDAQRLLRTEAALHGLDEAQQGAASTILMSLLDHQLLDEIRRATERWHEVPFAFPERGGRARPGVMVNGIIDLCYSTDPERKKWVVVDWKTDRPAPGTLTEVSYREQLRLYAQALIETGVGHRPDDVRMELVGPVEPEPDLRVLVDELDPRVRAPLEAALEAGCPEPEVLIEHEAGGVCELAWPELGLFLLAMEDPATRAALEAAGAHVFALDDAGVPQRLWEELALRADTEAGR